MIGYVMELTINDGGVEKFTELATGYGDLG